MARGDRLDVRADLSDVGRGGANERDEHLPWVLTEEAKTEERREAGDREELAGLVHVRLRVLIESKVVLEPGGIESVRGVEHEDAVLHSQHPQLDIPDDSGPHAAHLAPPAEGLATGEGGFEIEGTGDGQSVAHGTRVGRAAARRQRHSKGVSVDASRFGVGRSLGA